MNRFLDLHQNKIVTVMIVLGVAALIWIDNHRAQAPVLPVGQSAPSVTLTMLDGGRTLSLASLRGKPTVLDFWATWCGPCRASLPHINKIAQQYAGRVHVIAVDGDDQESAAAIEQARDQLSLTLPIAMHGEGVVHQFHVEAFPTTVILDRDGKMVDSITGGAADGVIESTLNKLL